MTILEQAVYLEGLLNAPIVGSTRDELRARHDKLHEIHEALDPTAEAHIRRRIRLRMIEIADVFRPASERSR